MLVGRLQEVMAIADLVRGDHPVVISGEPGIGKTTLLRAALEEAGRPALWGGALASLGWMEYAPLARALGVRRLEGDPATVARRVRDALGTDATLALDDAQWADGGTLEVIDLLARTAPIAATARTGHPAGDDLVARLEVAGFAVVRLEPLSEDDAARLVRSQRPDASEVAVSRLVRRCGGVPLLLTQLAGPRGEESESLRIALSTRLRTVSEGAADLFELLAVVGRPVGADMLDAALVAELVRAGLLAERAGDVEVTHAVLADLAVGRLADEARRALHARAADLVADSGESARHWEAAGDTERARGLALAAAEGSAGRPAEAATHLAVAARCSAGAEADALRLSAAAALVGALRHEDALRILDDVHGTDPAIVSEAAVLRSRAVWYLGDDEGFRAALATAIEAGERAGGKVRARALVERSRRNIFLDPDLEPGGVTLAREAMAEAVASGIPTARAAMLVGLSLYMVDDPAWQVELEAALVQARAENDLDTELITANNLVTAHESSGDPAAGRRLASEMVARAGAAGLVGWQLQFRAMLLNLDLHAADCLGTVAQAVELLDEPLDPRARAQVMSSLVVALIDLGRLEVARERLAQIERDEQSDLIAPDTLRWLQAEAELLGGRPGQAAKLAREAVQLGFGDPFATIVETWAAVDLRTVPPALDEHAAPMFAGVHAESLGAASLVNGEFRVAVRHFDEAADRWRTYHRRGEFRARWGAAEAARLAGDADDAARRLAALEADLTARQMRPMLARVHRSMRLLGLRRTAARGGRETAASLTAREHEVMRLVAGGLTNAEIGRRLGISRSTVTELVGGAMARLGAETRGQAAALLPQ